MCSGTFSAGNPHATFEVAGAGNQLTVWLLRHSQRKRRAPARLNLRSMAPVLDPTNLTTLRCRRHVTSGRQHLGTTAIAKGGPESPESLAQGMFPKGFPMNPGELPLSARGSGKTAAKGDRRRPRTDGRAVLRPRITYEGGEPQGFRKERPRHPLEGRGKQGDVSVEGNISETQNSSNYVHTTRQTN